MPFPDPNGVLLSRIAAYHVAGLDKLQKSVFTNVIDIFDGYGYRFTKDEWKELLDRLMPQEDAPGLNELTMFMRHSSIADVAGSGVQTLMGQSNTQVSVEAVFEQPMSLTNSPAMLRAWDMEDEKEAYHRLVDNGGRSCCPLGSLVEIANNQKEHDEILQPWQFYLSSVEVPLEAWQVFGRQLRRWKSFRQWQLDNRRLADNDNGESDFEEHWKQVNEFWKRRLLDHQYAEWLAEFEQGKSSRQKTWNDMRQYQRDHFVEPGCKNFHEYTESVKTRLQAHGFTDPIHLHKEVDRQDKLTTWKEYLGYECWTLDKKIHRAQASQAIHDEAWKNLVNSGVLTPDDTCASVQTEECRWSNQVEKARAQEALKPAELSVIEAYTAIQRNGWHMPGEHRRLAIQTATRAFKAAKARCDLAEKRDREITEFVWKTFPYTCAVSVATRQKLLVQWVLAQVPLIKAEKLAHPGGMKRPKSQGVGMAQAAPRKVRFNISPDVNTER